MARFHAPKILWLLVAFVMFGCGSKQHTTMDLTFVKRLEELGFFKYVGENACDAAQVEFQDIGWAAIYGETGQMFPADAESLAEGGIGEFIRDIEPFLTSQGITVNEVTDHFDENGYSVTVNGREYLIYDADELKRDEAQPGLIWGLATVRAFALINGLLADASSNEQLYAVNGGNDLFSIFLSSVLRAFICEHPDASPRDRPYLPREEHPWYGQEHE
jgi:hypothetical protein